MNLPAFPSFVTHRGCTGTGRRQQWRHPGRRRIRGRWLGDASTLPLPRKKKAVEQPRVPRTAQHTGAHVSRRGARCTGGPTYQTEDGARQVATARRQPGARPPGAAARHRPWCRAAAAPCPLFSLWPCCTFVHCARRVPGLVDYWTAHAPRASARQSAPKMHQHRTPSGIYYL